MSKSIKISTNPNDTEYHLYRKANIEIREGLTVLVGCNGSGKTTLLRLLKEYLKKNNIEYLSFNNITDGGQNAMSKAGFHSDFSLLALMAFSSEGENILTNIGKLARKIGTFIRTTNEKEIWILLDAIDSGLSIDNVVDLKAFFNTVINDCRESNKEIYIIVSANEYELVREQQCFDVYLGKYRTFQNYDDFRAFILDSREKKDKRYKDK